MGVCLDEDCPLTWMYGWDSAAEASFLSSFFWLLLRSGWNVLLILLRYLYAATPAGISSSSRKTAGHAGGPSAGSEHVELLFPKTHVLLTIMICKKKKQDEQLQLFYTQSSNRLVESVLDSMTLVNSFSCFQLNIFLFRFSMKEYKTGSSSLQDKTIFFF